MGEFKKFIQTNGKSFEEIKKTINDLVNRAVDNVVDTVADDVTQFAPKDVRKSVKKSVRDARKNAAEGAYKPEKIPERCSKNDGVELIRRADAPLNSQIHYPPEFHSDKLTEHEEYMLEKIRQMRELEICVRGQGIVKRAVELTMVEQGAFMADVEDDFTRKAFCALPQPLYAAMSNSQLRTFFTWRTDARRGKFPETDKPYVLLYCYELLNKIGAESSVDAFDKMLETWEGCRSFAPYLNKLMPRWLKDFYAFNDVTEKYHEIAQAPGEDGDLSEIVSEFERGDYSGKFTFLAEYSAYDIKSSIFCDEKTQPLIEACCEASLYALHDYFEPFGIELSDLVCGKLKKDYTWSPFKDAIVNLDTTDGFRPVRISAAERYCIKRGEPALEMFCFSPSRGFIGYLLKSVEAELRVKTGFKRKIVPKLQMLSRDFVNRVKITEAISRPEFLKVIPKAVDEYCAKNGIKAPEKRKKTLEEDEHIVYTAPKVKIDVSKLEEIRRNSEEISRKLIVGEQDEIEPPEPLDIRDFAEDSASCIEDDEFSAVIDECKEELSAQEDEEFPLNTGNRAFEQLDVDWQKFANDLTPIQIQTLKALTEDNVRVFCKERGLLPETVFEEINTEALSAFGDVVIECGELVPDYAEDIMRIVKCSGI